MKQENNKIETKILTEATEDFLKLFKTNLVQWDSTAAADIAFKKTLTGIKNKTIIPIGLFFNNKLVGEICVQNDGEIVRLFVDENYRQKGFSHILINAAVQQGGWWSRIHSLTKYSSNSLLACDFIEIGPFGENFIFYAHKSKIYAG